MKYSDLIQFDPIETVVQIRGAEEPDEAARLVSTYAISEPMAERLSTVVMPNLQFKRPADQKGLLVTGNYGTGKSHLLAVISAVAERADLADELRSEQVRQAAGEIAGAFKVIRTEIGATQMPLRDILVGEIEDALSEWGIDFTFPSMAEVSNNKDSLIEMMAAFQECFPGQGLLIVVDEMLDYLRSRDEQAIVLDLGFLREIGEVCRDTRLRFIGGLQESLFDSPRFQFVAGELNRVKDRYEQVRIAREDVTYVVSERLLRKTDQQRAQIRAYLEPFAPLYPEMAERLDTYVNLFPVHPAYIRAFEAIHVIEKREILKTLSRAMAERLNDTVSEQYPSLIAYDSYWDILRTNPAFRSIPDVREVIDKSTMLESKVESAYTRPVYKPVALRIIHALSVQRLTTGDLKAPIGLTPAELRDDLCLYLPLPEQDPEFLESTIESAIKEISRTVSGQYLGFNESNGQWYLDLSKDIDYDALIQQRADTLSPNQLDRYFYDALEYALELRDVGTHVSGFRIWQYQVDWPEKKVTRPGYLFFGAPNQRSTAQPPREFYLYFLPVYDAPSYTDEQRPDEVFFRLARRDEDFNRALRLYGGAMAMADSASSATKSVYLDKATSINAQRPGYLRQVIDWLQKNAITAIEITCQGGTRPAAELVKSQAQSLRDMVNAAASSCLAPYFRDQMPDYPAFPIRITQENRGGSAAEAIRWLAGSLKTQQGTAILTGLELLDGDKLSVQGSRYARYILHELNRRGEGQVLNRSDLIESQYQGQIECDRRFHLEPEWVAVLLVALAHAGEITITAPGVKIDAGNIDQAVRTPVDTLASFQYIQRPKDVPVVALTALFDVLGLQSGLVKDPNTHAQAVTELQQRVSQELQRALNWRKKVADGLSCWNSNILEGAEKSTLIAQLDSYKSFLDSLTPINTPGKLKNFRFSAEEVQKHAQERDSIRSLEQLSTLVSELQPVGSYLLQAHSVLPADTDVSRRILETQKHQLGVLRDPTQRLAPGAADALLRESRAVKDEYVQEYIQRHNRARLNMSQDQRKVRLTNSKEMKRLRALRNVSIFQGGALAAVENDLQSLRMCTGVSAVDLANTPVCPHCGFKPAQEEVDGPAAARLENVEQRLETLQSEWTNALVQNLGDPTIQVTLHNLSPAERKPLDAFLASRQLPEEVDQPFLKALNAAFSGIEPITMEREFFYNRLTKGGVPSTVDEMTERLKVLLDEKTKGKDRSRVRIIVE